MLKTLCFLSFIQLPVFFFFLFLAFVSCHPSSHIYCLHGFHEAPAANSFVYQAFNIFARLFISPLCFHPGLWICATEDILPQLLLVIRRCPPSPLWPLRDASGSQSKQAQKSLSAAREEMILCTVYFFRCLIANVLKWNYLQYLL